MIQPCEVHMADGAGYDGRVPCWQRPLQVVPFSASPVLHLIEKLPCSSVGGSMQGFVQSSLRPFLAHTNTSAGQQPDRQARAAHGLFVFLCLYFSACGREKRGHGDVLRGSVAL